MRRRAPDSAEYARDLVVSCHRLSSYHAQAGDRASAAAYVRRGLEILRSMKAAGIYMDSALEQVFRQWDGASRAAETSGYASAAHPGADANLVMRLNLEYQKVKRAWQSLPWWRRLTTKEPERPKGDLSPITRCGPSSDRFRRARSE